jgi:hypothetical protein
VDRTKEVREYLGSMEVHLDRATETRGDVAIDHVVIALRQIHAALELVIDRLEKLEDRANA